MRAQILLLATLLAGACNAGADDLTVERLFAAPDPTGGTLRSPQFSPDGSRLSYLKARPEEADVYDLWEFDVGTRTHRRLVDSRVLEPEEKALSAEEETRRERQRTAALRGIVEYQWAPDGHALLFPLGGDLYYYDLRTTPDRAVRRLTSTEAYETDARISPRGRYVSFIRDQDLFVLELATGKEHALTTDGQGLVSNGVAEFIAQEEMKRSTGYWWSPDDRSIAFTRVDESPVPDVQRFEVQADGITIYNQRYPAAGTVNATVTLGVVDVASDSPEPRWLDLGPDRDIYLARVHWFPEGDALLVQRLDRSQKRLDLLRYPAAGGPPRLLFSETSNVWVDLHDDLRFIRERRQIVWASQRSGHNHLYLYDYDGRLVRPLTAGEWDVDGDCQDGAICGVDPELKRVYFVATERSPLERHLYFAPLDARSPARPRRLSQDGGYSTFAMSPDARVYLQARSDPAQPVQASLHDASGRQLAWVMENRLDASHPYAPYLPRHVVPEFGTLPAADGTPLFWKMYRPPGFDATRKYPVIVMVYGGPHAQNVTRAFGSRIALINQVLAQHGYVVFQLDNRGTAARGLRFAGALAGQLGKVEVEDQLAGVRYLRSLPWVDPARIGVHGWSYGGYMTLMLMARGAGMFRAGVAGAPVTDWRLYDTHYTERYLGQPRDNAAGYDASGVFPWLEGLQGHLLVMHGMADDNVLFTNSTRLFKALVDAQIQFDAMLYPGSKHAALSFRDTGIHGWNTIIRYFDLHLRGVDRLEREAAR